MPRLALLLLLLAGAAALAAQPAQPTIIWDPSPNYNSRGGTTIDTIVIHTTEGTYSGAVSWLKNPSAGASAHYVVKEDGTEIRQLVADSDRAWHATYYNSRSIGIECAGYAGQASTWTQGILPALYDLVAWLCYTHGVQVVHPPGQATSQTQQDFSGTGLVAHAQIQPWNRTDPGAYFDWAALVTEVNTRLGVASSDRIVDNVDPGFSVLSGSWSTGNTAAGRYGADYRYAATGTSVTAEAEWRPTLPHGGDYAVEVWYPQGTNRASNAPFTVYHANGTSAVAVNQQSNGGAWYVLGSYPFFTGSTGFVRLANNANPSVVIADAVRFRLVSAAPAAPAPTGLTATALNATEIQFGWNWSSYADGYEVQIAQSAADLTGAGPTRQSVTLGRVNTYTWQGLTPATTYWWRVRAFNVAGGNFATPAPASLATPAGSPPAAPTALAATAQSDTSIQFSWVPGANTDGFWLDIAQSSTDLAAGTGAPTFQTTQLSAATNSYLWVGLSPGATYFWRVYAYNTAGGVHAWPTPASVATTGGGSHGEGGGGSGDDNDAGCAAAKGGLPWLLGLLPLLLRRRRALST
ncbi:MAG: N-acetylmuramoyl-L-alanine amidase [Planctomycetes bacterium]|nr:N-acetylmuramoyl-L-alanine amidase [Planctomycetota bacterium]